MADLPKFAARASFQCASSCEFAYLHFLKMIVMPEIIHYQSCPICNSADIQLQLTAKDYTVSQENFDVWHCMGCQARFTQDIPVESEIGAYYQAEEYISHTNTSKGIVNKLYQLVRNYTLKQKLKLINTLTARSSGKLLDIGCGTGDFLGTMKAGGWDVLGLEPDGGARKLAKENHNLETHSPEKLFDLPENQFDVVTMWHVLEHVHRLHEYAEQIKSILKPNGTLIVAVPNYQSKDAEIYQAHWAAYDVPRHLYHFSHTSIQKLFEQHGMTVQQMKHMVFDSFYVSLLSEKYKNGKLRLVPAFLNGFRSYTHAAGSPERCSSIIYVIQAK